MNKIDHNFVLLTTFQYSFEAMICKAKLESNDIEVFIKDNHIIDANPLYSNAIGGVKLFVHNNELETARQIVGQTSQYSLDDNNNLLKCPNCGAEKIEMTTSIEDTKSLITFLLGILLTPFMFFIKHKYRCYICKHEFKKID